MESLTKTCSIANMLEVIVLLTDEGTDIIHAMPLRAIYRRLLGQ